MCLIHRVCTRVCVKRVSYLQSVSKSEGCKKREVNVTYRVFFKGKRRAIVEKGVKDKRMCRCDLLSAKR